MRGIAHWGGALLLVLATVSPGHTDGSVSAGVEIGKDGIEGFHLAVCSHYGFKTETVAVVHKHRIPDEHIPVVYHIAHCAKVSPDVVIGLRLGGKSWWQISAHFGLSSEVFYVPVTHAPGPPYGKAWGHFKKGKHTNWSAVRLSDDDVVTLVNVKFLAAHHGCSPDEVIKMRAEGGSFLKLHVGLNLSGGGKGKLHAGGGKSSVRVQAGGSSGKVKFQAPGPSKDGAGGGKGGKGGKRK